MTLSFDSDRRNFLSLAGKGLGLAALSSSTVAALLKEVAAASRSVAHLTTAQAAMDEDYWSVIQNSFTVTRGIINLNNGGVSPSPRIVTEALVRYIWQQEDATAYTMWQILEPQSETIRTGLAEVFGCDREEIAITRNASESLEVLLMGMDFKSGDEILTTTQDYPRMLTTLRQRERREGLALKLIKIPIPPKNLSEIVAAFEKGITNRTRLILMAHQVNITGQITPVKAVCEMARARGIETIVDGAHSFAQFDFKQKDLGCDYFGTSLHKWLYAPKGTGMLYVKRDKIAKMFADTTEGFAAFASVNARLSGYRPIPVIKYALELLSTTAHGQTLPAAPPPLPAPQTIKNSADYAGTFTAMTAGQKKLTLISQGEQLILDHAGQRIVLEQVAPDRFIVKHPDFELFVLSFGREQGAVVEAFHGGSWWTNERYSGAKSFAYPPSWDMYTGHFRSDNAWYGSTRMVIRKGRLRIGGDDPLVEVSPGVFRPEDDTGADRITFDTIIEGRAIHANFSGIDFYRTFTT